MIFYLFYKCFLLVLPFVWYLFYSASSGQKIYIEAMLQLYNLVWTSIPIMICTVYDRDVSDSLSRKLPQLYHLGIRRAYFNLGTVFWWIGCAVIESLVIFYSVLYA